MSKIMFFTLFLLIIKNVYSLNSSTEIILPDEISSRAPQINIKSSGNIYPTIQFSDLPKECVITIAKLIDQDYFNLYNFSSTNRTYYELVHVHYPTLFIDIKFYHGAKSSHSQIVRAVKEAQKYFDLKLNRVDDYSILYSLKREDEIFETLINRLFYSDNLTIYRNFNFMQRKLVIAGERNRVSLIPLFIFYLKHLEILECCHNGLEFLSPKIIVLRNLKILDLSHNQLEFLPCSIGQLTMLEYLDVSNNDLLTLPPELENLTNLNSLLLSNNLLTELPDLFFKLSNLEKLFIFNNQLAYLPPSIYSLTNLRCLDASQNKLSSLLPLVGNWNRMWWLDVSRNDLISLPIQIRAMRRLKHLVVSNNYLQYLPDIFHFLKKLRVLNFSYNQIRIFPRSICLLSKLVSLDYSSNLIKFLPLEYKELHNNKTLTIKG